jgi:hypothetical protein
MRCTRGLYKRRRRLYSQRKTRGSARINRDETDVMYYIIYNIISCVRSSARDVRRRARLFETSSRAHFSRSVVGRP